MHVFWKAFRGKGLLLAALNTTEATKKTTETTKKTDEATKKTDEATKKKTEATKNTTYCRKREHDDNYHYRYLFSGTASYFAIDGQARKRRVFPR